MPLIKLDNGCLAYGHVPLLDAAQFQLDPGERVALIGRNGTGKSSLLAALAGRAHLDDGIVWTQPALKLGYVPQEPPCDPALTVFQAVVAGMGETARLLADYHDVAHQLTEADADHEVLLERLQHLQHDMETLGVWAYEARAEQVITRFDLDADALVGTLSGGQKKRLALAQALAVAPEVLLLDEPTNHLDIATIEWLEDYLLETGITLLFITHDRRFLDRLATRIIELDRGMLTSYPGNFAAYQDRKTAELADEAKENARFDKLLKEEEVWIRQGVEARRTRAVFRVQRLDQLRTERIARRDRLGQVKLQLDSGDKSGKLVAELKKVNKSFGTGSEMRHVVRDFSCRIQRGDKIGVIGPNGAGKTTLLRLILGELEPDSGTVRRGTKMEVAYFDQFRAQLDPEATLAEIISPGSDYVEIGGTRKHVVGYLGDFLFAPQRARSPVKSLSGGERNRLLLARLFARPANVLVLDEPTNDLDIDTLELLEDLIQDYAGTVFLVSHDRAFLDAIVTQTLAAEGDGTWREYAGGYSDWAAYQADRKATARAAQQAATSSAQKSALVGRQAEKPAATKLSWKEARELEALPEKIAALEAEQKSLSARLADATIYQQQPQEAQTIAARLSAIDAELHGLLERWEALEAR
ncbi:MAG: ATP-binding cassette domain-containing protein [Gammaproteobacteria bacterium]|nr:ATP-binding cassette domain-containing protein [Rhodocyclaceae bacterium]MBU3908408.1 ATP-binding cassette domain-containing protein [Gammaproteobacteria bacterium]MBU3988541.1 ATP-binding cassette domain-containing protein [Gammaproteobacteria bacterium]MBU4005957.1 ATP-binding cassette domain-containing protein [Gammaproteobacteria bacterium]MBU4021039.1 ATP-binding cassette domain-containing protein [Gammaproteobacteria bacterium]